MPFFAVWRNQMRGCGSWLELSAGYASRAALSKELSAKLLQAAPILAAPIECGVFVANHRRCPLTGVVENLGEEHGRVSDIFLPRWFADHIPQIFTPPILIEVLALDHRDWREGRASAAPPGFEFWQLFAAVDPSSAQDKALAPASATA